MVSWRRGVVGGRGVALWGRRVGRGVVGPGSWVVGSWAWGGGVVASWGHELLGALRAGGRGLRGALRGELKGLGSGQRRGLKGELKVLKGGLSEELGGALKTLKRGISSLCGWGAPLGLCLKL